MVYKDTVTTQVKPVSFSINEQTYTVHSGEVSAHLTLANYLRNHLGLTGTKVTCAQAGCGACVVTAEIMEPTTGQWVVKSVNSCITPILSCDGWFITTVEGLGSKKNGLHPIQARLAAFHGTQCGYCTPGMIMQMNSLMSKNPDATMKDIENIFDGNLCRCTGYRPIFDAFKSMASDATPDLTNRIPDIEDMDKVKICPKTREPCAGKCSSGKGVVGKLRTPEGDWYMPNNLDDLLAILGQLPSGTKYRLVAGNTSGVTPDFVVKSDVFIDVKKVGALTICKTSPELELGGGMNLNDVLQTVESMAETNKEYFYGKALANHLRKVANTAVRHMGTLAGNLMIKHTWNAFPSDVFVMLETLGAHIVTVGGEVHECSASYHPSEWLKHSMDKKVILKVILPKLDPETHVYKSYKITPRSQNAHAYVNAGFLMKVNREDGFRILEKPSIVYGNISGEFHHASKTENYLLGKCLSKIETLRGAFEVLDQEVVPHVDHLTPSVQFRKHLTKALLYKFALTVLGDAADPVLRSGADQIHMPQRGLSHGEQHYASDKDQWPLNMGVPKIEGQSQCTGEAEYVNDMPAQAGELYAAFVITDVANCDLDVVDPSEALKVPGVVTYVDHKDVPGNNNWSFFDVQEEIFTTGHVYFAGQTIGMIVAKSAVAAQAAAKLVKVTYKNRMEPILSIKQAMEKDPSRVKSELGLFMGHPVGPSVIGDVEALAENPNLRVMEGEVEIGSQYHFYMENQACIVRPCEEGQFEIFSTCQWMHIVQSLAAGALGISKNKVDVKVRRLGGGYGGKCVPSQLVACACAVAANKVNKPVRVVIDLQTNMAMFGKRDAYLGRYKVGVTDSGILDYVDLKLYSATGWNISQSTMVEAIQFSQNVYNASAWNIVPHAVVTDTVPNTFTRSPGSTQGHNIIEYVMEHLAKQLGMDPIELRLKNLLKDGDPLVTGKIFNGENPTRTMIETLKASSQYEERKKSIREFNENNMWRKRGMALVPSKYGINYFPFPNYCHISVYEGDGTVSVATGGIEMGQGLNTKVAQAVAKELNIPLELIIIKPADTFVEPNNWVTGGSMTSELCVHAARMACQKLKDRMATVISNLQGAKWHELVTACHYQGVDLCVRHMGHSVRDGIQDYFIWGCAVSEVEVDLLTGEKKILRSDILADTGASLNPEVDIGQIEGAFSFGLGLWLQEELVHDPKTGKLLTNDTWEYKPPASFDIPEDLRVTLYEWEKTSGRGVLGSKATGEPATLMAVSAALALKNALDAGREAVLEKDPKHWVPLSGPATVEKTQLVSGITSEQFRL